jgi:LysR family transcriptional regulator, D-serine deaminase activator
MTMKPTPQQLSHMQTFVVVARLMSFTLASEELCLTQGAISHRIGCLEAALGFKLFVRLTRKLELTEEGERLLATLTHAFRLLDAELDSIRNNELDGELYVGVAPTFALSWLIPRLPDFQRQYPNLNLRLRVKASKLDFEHEPVDMAIYYSNGQHPGFYQARLYEEWLTPVLSPAYAEHLGLSTDAGRLAQANFIHCIEAIDTISPTHEWERWLAAQPLEFDLLSRHTIINHAEMALGAARYAMGVAMGRVSLARPHLERGELIAPLPALPSGLGYDLICPAGLEQRPRYKAFADWLLEQAGSERRLNAAIRADSGMPGS